MRFDDIKTKRIRFICQFLTAGGGTLKEMHKWVNQKLVEVEERPVRLRTIQYCIEDLRKGRFEHSDKEKSKRASADLFKVKVVEGNKYKWEESSELPKFGDLEENERFTLPFLAGILKQYESIPAVQKILIQLPQIFNISEAEMASKKAVFHTGPEFYDDTDLDFQQKVIDCVIKLLSCIHHGQCIEFNYTPTKNYENTNIALNLKSIAPLQIRFYENYYYLIGYEVNSKYLATYRVDQIHRQKIDLMLNENDEVVTFDLDEIERITKIRSRFKHSLGVWPDSDEDQLYDIHIKFYDFAATYVKRLRFHPSQKIISESKDEKSITISLRLSLRKKTEQRKEIEERQFDLAFLLGRFRKYAEIIDAIPV